MSKIRIGTRASKLALVQAGWLKDILEPLPTEIVPMSTEGDRETGELEPASKGWFVDEIREAVARGDADMAVHSAKDLPTYEQRGLVLGAITVREDPRDVLIGSLHDGARVGTSSLRRAAQLRALGRGLEPVPIRGNVDTRLRKLDEGSFDAVLLAMAGLRRLNLQRRATEILEPEDLLPAPGQGALAVECRVDDLDIREALLVIEDAESRWAFEAERELMIALDADCKLPLGALATVEAGLLRLRARVASVDGSRIIADEISGHDPIAMATELADRLRGEGAAELIAAARE